MTFDDYESDDAGLEEITSLDIDFNSESGNILSIKYNLATQSLFVEFHNGLYRINDVPLSIAKGFEGASSATRYYNDQIKGRFTYEAA